jgi:hypothetical protein
MRAFSTWRAARLPVWISVSSRSRSATLSLTTYLFTAACFSPKTHLRHCRAIDSHIDRKINDEEH